MPAATASSWSQDSRRRRSAHSRNAEMVRIKSLLAGASLTLRGASYSRRRVHSMAMPRSSGSETRRSRAGGAEIRHRGDKGGAGERAPLLRSQFKFFLSVHDRSCLEQDDELIIAIHAGLGVDQDAAAMAH